MTESPHVACSLTNEELSSRADPAAVLGRSGLIEVSASGSTAVLMFKSPDVDRASIDEFVDAESKCCPFFSFDVEESSDTIRLRIEAPEEGAPLTRGLVAGFTDGWRLNA